MRLTRRSAIAGLTALPFAARGAEDFILLGSTTTTENSGLLGHLIPIFEAETGTAVRVVVAGTGKILRLLEDGDLDLSLTHFPEGEAEMVARGVAAVRLPVMSNDFLLIGPADDPAGVRGAETAGDAMRRIAKAEATFYSRGDESGTHRKERSLWPVPPLSGAAAPRWYRETGAGMGATLNIAASAGGYALADRGTWAAFGNRGDLRMVYEGGDDLANPYAILLPVATTANPNGARRFADWLSSEVGRDAVDAYRVSGEQVFFAVR
ncbi:MAG: substrate-binding domain-containing protein [Pseudomonadota bacterium]